MNQSQNPHKSQPDNSQKQSDQKNSPRDEQKQPHLKKKKKSKHRKHPPEYYQQLRLAQLNKKRQQKWNDRFMNGTIPTIPNDIFHQRKTFSLHRVNRRYSKRHSSPKQSGIIYKTTFEQHQKRQKSKCSNPKTQDKNQSTLNTKKQDHSRKHSIKDQNYNQQNDSQTPIQQQDRDKLIQQVRKSQQQHNFQKCHQQALIDIIKKFKQRGLRKYIYSVIDRLKSNTNVDLSNQVQNSINKRQQLKQKMQNAQGQIPYQLIQQYRLSTVKVIQQIIKWRQQMQILYKHQHFKPKVNFIYDGQNYLTKINHDIKPKPQLNNQQGNPFLLGFANKIIPLDIYVKVRACQVFLLEQQMFVGI